MFFIYIYNNIIYYSFVKTVNNMQTKQDGVRLSAHKLLKATHTSKSDRSKFIDKRSETVNVSMKIFSLGMKIFSLGIILCSVATNK